MTSLVLNWLIPLGLGLLPFLLRIKRLRFALIWILFGYVIIAFGKAVIPAFLEISVSGEGDPQLMAGQISESLVTSLLAIIIHVPLALLIFWALRRLRNKA